MRDGFMDSHSSIHSWQYPFTHLVLSTTNAGPSKTRQEVEGCRMGVETEDKEVIKNSPVSMWLETDRHALNTGAMLLMVPSNTRNPSSVVQCSEGHGICFWVSHQLFQHHNALNPALPLQRQL